MHELGHALGLSHVESSTSALLMEPYINGSFDGPQLDDVRGLHGLYGDAFEKSNNGQGNGAFEVAVELGDLSLVESLSIGSAAATTSQAVPASATDFVSIANAADVDFYSFSISTAALLDVELTPWGGVFSQAAVGDVQSTFDANSRNDLSLAIFGSDGQTLLSAVDVAVAGRIESIDALQLPSAGEYLVRITGADDHVQLYELQLSLTQALTSLDGDMDGDGDADGADFLAWQRGGSPAPLSGADLTEWEANFGAFANQVTTARTPEPGSFCLAVVCLLASRMGSLRKVKPCSQFAEVVWRRA
jgi:hypothetical protein